MTRRIPDHPAPAKGSQEAKDLMEKVRGHKGRARTYTEAKLRVLKDSSPAPNDSESE